MRTIHKIAGLAAAGLLAINVGPAAAQQKGGGMVCWKDKAGKTVGCGDKVPPEYQDNANAVINQRGVTVKETDAALTPEQRAAQKAAAEQKKVDAQKRAEEERRDRALLDSFSNEKEIDLKRARDIQQIEVTISAQQSLIKSITDRQTETRGKIDELKKGGKPVPPQIQQEYDKQTTDLTRLQDQVTQKRKEIADKNVDYDAMKKRFVELKSAAAKK